MRKTDLVPIRGVKMGNLSLPGKEAFPLWLVLIGIIAFHASY
jgi:hypothetical protein